MAPLRPLLATLVLTTLALSTSGAAQQATFRAGTRTVPVYATVTDANGRLVPDLDRSHFEIYDNGKKQDVTLFENAIQPISVVVMLDTSGSMTMHLDLLKQAATQFVIRLLPEDRPTALWDATDRSMDALTGIDGRRVVLVFTDGGDNHSDKDQKDVLSRARAEEFMIYAIGLRSRVRGQGVTQPDRGLRKVADETGGGYFELEQTDELNSTFTRVAQELHSQYVLGFSPQPLDGKTHALEVRLTQPGLTARARRSYIAK